MSNKYPLTFGVPKTGVLITSVREWRYPSKPGDGFTDAAHGLFVRLNGFAGDVAVNVPHTQSAPGPGAGLPLGVAPLWPHHVNAMFGRTHTMGTPPSDDVRLDVRVTQPALITSNCGTPSQRATRHMALPPVDPAEGAAGSLEFRGRDDSLGVEMVAPADARHDRAASNVVATRVGFQTFTAGDVATQRTHFRLKANRGCAGETTDIAVAVTPPATAEAGEGATIGNQRHRRERVTHANCS